MRRRTHADSLLSRGFFSWSGLSITGLWIVLLATANVPEINEGDSAIWFHVGAEFLTAVLLVAAGVLTLRRISTGDRLAGVALGALLYTTINSAGFYAERGEWTVVAMFSVLSAVTVISAFMWSKGRPLTSERRARGRQPGYSDG